MGALTPTQHLTRNLPQQVPGWPKFIKKSDTDHICFFDITMLATGAASRFGRRRFFVVVSPLYLSFTLKEYDMFKKWCTIKTRLPRPQPAETIASINLFLETLPQFSDSDLTLTLDEEAGTYIYPTDELKGATWLATATEPRWEDDASAIDWAYKTLEGTTVMRFITLLQPMKTLHKGEILEYFAYRVSGH